MKKKFAVLSRTGKSSLHSNWVNEDYSKRSWDLFLIFFDREAYENFKTEEGVSKDYVKGGKFTGIYKFLEKNNILEKYDYFWIADDDLLIDSKSINKIFELMEQYNFSVGQPALSKDSYYTWLILIQNNTFKVRYSNFVEIMAPCISQKVLKNCLCDFKNAHTGLGIDQLWKMYSNNEKDKIVILDEVSIKHTRPVGGPIYSKLKKNNINKFEEFNTLLNKYNKKKIKPIVYKAIMKDGSIIKNKYILGFLHIKEYFLNRNEFIDKKLTLNKLLRLFKYYFIYLIKI